MFRPSKEAYEIAKDAVKIGAKVLWLQLGIRDENAKKLVEENKMKYMIEYGFKVYPVNPSAKGEKIIGEEVYAKITDIKKNVDIVDVFRPSKEAYGIAKDAVKIGAKVLWLQLGIRNENAKKLVEENKMEYIENKCTKMEYQKHFLKVRPAFPVLSD